MEKDDLLNMKRNKNVKKPLLYGAVAFLIFIIAVIVYALYSNSKEEKNVVLPPQIETKEKVSEFKSVPIEEDIKKDVSIEENSTFTKPVEENSKKEIIVPKEEAKPTKSENKEIKSKEVKSIQKKVQKVTAKKNFPKIKHKYYIQVAALMKYKKPNEKFLNLIKKEGFNYTFYHTYVIKNGKKIPVTKILIGPFKDIESAKNNLKFVKEKITKNAFIFKVKE